MSIILASASPRRRELLSMLGLTFTVCPACGEENAVFTDPGTFTEALAEAKAEEIAQSADAGDIIIAADTIVYYDGNVLGKPKSREDAYAMLSMLSGRTHYVYTGLCVKQGKHTEKAFQSTAVTFKKLSEDTIRAYIATGEPMDKAGAYGAQSIGALLVERIDGDFFNVVGLPCALLSELLKKFGINLLHWDGTV